MNPNSEFVQFVLAGQKISAIKAVREFIGTVNGAACSGLKECKDFVEAMTPLIKAADAITTLTKSIDDQIAVNGKETVLARLREQIRRIESTF